MRDVRLTDREVLYLLLGLREDQRMFQYDKQYARYYELHSLLKKFSAIESEMEREQEERLKEMETTPST